MTEFTLVNHADEKTKTFEARSDAEESRDDMLGLGVDPSDLDVVQGAWENYAEATEALEAADTVTEQVAQGTEAKVEATDGGPEVVENATPVQEPDQLPDDPSVADDPVDWLPAHFIDQIQGVPTVNRKGYAVIASKYGVSVEAEPVTLPSETDFEYAEFRATATTAEGETYSGFGSAHVDRQDGDDKHLLAELAETRAMKRATAWATGVGMTAVEELQNDL
jgi:hypothetical protein